MTAIWSRSLQEITDYLDTLPGVEQAGVAVRVMGGETVIELMVWGQDLAADDLAGDLRARFPLLAEAEIASEELAGTVQGSLAEAFGTRPSAWKSAAGRPRSAPSRSSRSSPRRASAATPRSRSSTARTAGAPSGSS